MMDEQALRRLWLEEERQAHIHGWDFSHLHNRYTEDYQLPWSYEDIVRAALTPEKQILDMDTGGGELLLSFGHPFANTAATEAYPPNVALCRETLLPLGIDFRQADGCGPLPFADESFDLVLNRHGSFHCGEIFRVLRPGGRFITQQVGGENDRELAELVLPEPPPPPNPGQYLAPVREELLQLGFQILQADEVFRPIRFYDVGALVWFARVIPWEFPDFSVERCFDRLLSAQTLLEQQGWLEGRVHRFLLVAEKPSVTL